MDIVPINSGNKRPEIPHIPDINTKEDALKLFGLSQGFDLAILKKIFRRLAILYHPDKNKQESAKEDYAKLVKAYELASSCANQSADSQDHANQADPFADTFADSFGESFVDNKIFSNFFKTFNVDDDFGSGNNKPMENVLPVIFSNMLLHVLSPLKNNGFDIDSYKDDFYDYFADILNGNQNHISVEFPEEINGQCVITGECFNDQPKEIPENPNIFIISSTKVKPNPEKNTISPIILHISKNYKKDIKKCTVISNKHKYIVGIPLNRNRTQEKAVIRLKNKKYTFLIQYSSC